MMRNARNIANEIVENRFLYNFIAIITIIFANSKQCLKGYFWERKLVSVSKYRFVLVLFYGYSQPTYYLGNLTKSCRIC